MATSPQTAAFVQERLGRRFALRKMFGEYAVYAEAKVVALLCDDRLHVKVHEATAALADCELAPPYPGAKPHYVVEEGRWGDPSFAALLLKLAKALPEPKKKPSPKKAAKKQSKKTG
jgi:TfoX/Sxy family transcriptional regulator of competence genes